MDFFWTVSSAKTKKFPKNEFSEFFSELSPTRTLNNYEVGVVSAIFPRSLAAYGPNNSSLTVTGRRDIYADGVWGRSEFLHSSDNFLLEHLERGYINKSIFTRDWWTNGVYFGNYKTDGRLDIRLNPEGQMRMEIQNRSNWRGSWRYVFDIEGKLALLLGYKSGKVRIGYDTSEGYYGDVLPAKVAEYPFRIPQLRSVYVYTDLVKSSLISDTTFKILMHAPVELVNNEFKVMYEPNEIVYTPLSHNVVSKMQFTIADETGNKIYNRVPTENVYLTLHFRSIQ